MKSLLITLALAASALIASAQTTNVTVSVLVEEPNRTNTLNLSLSQLHVLGLSLSWQDAQAAGATNTFRNQVRQEVKDRIESLRAEGGAYERKTAKVDSITASILANWEQASAADRKLLTDWLAKYPVTP